MPISLQNIEIVNGVAIAIFDNGARVQAYPGPGGLWYPRANAIDDPNLPPDDIGSDPVIEPDPTTTDGVSDFKWPFSLASWNPPRDHFRSAERPTHSGMDMSNADAFNGAWIRAVGDGTVYQAAFSDYGGGYEVIINHGRLSDGHIYHSYSSHGQAGSFQVATGDAVVQGQNLSKIGSTGNSTGPHLHFGIRRVTSPVDWVDPKIFMANFNPDNLTL